MEERESVCERARASHRSDGWWSSTEMISLLAERTTNTKTIFGPPTDQHGPLTFSILMLFLPNEILNTGLCGVWCSSILSTDWCWSFISRTRWFLFYKLPFNGVWFDYKHSHPSFSFFCSPRVLHNISNIAILPQWCLSILGYSIIVVRGPH